MKPEEISRKGQLTHLLAQDIFSDDTKLVFSARTGKIIGSIKEGDAMPEDKPEEQTPPKPEKIDKQLNLF